MDEKFKDALRKIGFSDQEVQQAEERSRHVVHVPPRNKIERAVVIYRAITPEAGDNFLQAFQKSFRGALETMGLTSHEIDYIVGPQQPKEE